MSEDNIDLNFREVKQGILTGNWTSRKYNAKGELIGVVTSLQDGDGHIVLHSHNSQGDLLSFTHIRTSDASSIPTQIAEDRSYNQSYLFHLTNRDAAKK